MIVSPALLDTHPGLFSLQKLSGLQRREEEQPIVIILHMCHLPIFKNNIIIWKGTHETVYLGIQKKVGKLKAEVAIWTLIDMSARISEKEGHF